MVASSTLVLTPLDSYELLKRDEVECPAKGDESEPKVDCWADPGLPPTGSKRLRQREESGIAEKGRESDLLVRRPACGVPGVLQGSERRMANNPTRHLKGAGRAIHC